MLLNGIGRETPVGPPWITTSSGYFRAGWKSDRLVQHAFDRRAVLALPGDDLERRGRPAGGLRAQSPSACCGCIDATGATYTSEMSWRR